jgi:hypothetical protein
MFYTNVVQTFKTHILCLATFSQKSCPLGDNVEKYGRPREATGDKKLRCMHFAWLVTKATDTHSEYLIFIAS